VIALVVTAGGGNKAPNFIPGGSNFA